MPGRLSRTLRQGRPRRGADGFTLIEVMVALAMLSIVAVALAAFFISTLKGTQELKIVQNGQLVADSDMELIHGLNGADLVTGRYSGDVSTQWQHAPSQVSTLLTSLSQASDPKATSGSASALVPLVGEPADPESTTSTSVVTPVLDGTSYTVNNYIGTCNQPIEMAGTIAPVATPSPSGTSCSTAYTGNKLYEVIVAVSWRAAAGEGCVNHTCYYLDSALISPSATTGNPVFLDGNGATVTATPTPSYVTVVDQATAVSEQSTTINPLTGDTPGSWSSNTLNVTSGPSDGTATAANNKITYRSTDFSGYDNLTYSVAGANGTTYYSSVRIKVTPYAGATSAAATVNQSSSCPKHASCTYTYTYSLSLSASNLTADGSGLTITSAGPASKGTASLSGGVVTYSYSVTSSSSTDPGGTATIPYTVTDSNGWTASNTVTVTL